MHTNNIFNITYKRIFMLRQYFTYSIDYFVSETHEMC